MDLKYIGHYDYRTIRDEDLERQGISGFTTTTWLKAETKTVQDAGGQWLADNLPAEFQIAAAPMSTLSSTTTRTASTSTTDKTSSSK